MIPTAVLGAMPDGLKTTWLGTPIWKVLIVLVIVVLMGLLVGLLHWFLRHREPDGRVKSLCSRMLQPFAAILLVLVMTNFIDNQLLVVGDFSTMVDFTGTLLIYMAFSWIFWLAVQLLFELIILSPRIPEEGLDANLLRLLGGLIGLVGVILILAYGGQELGLPVFSLLAGLGIGGLAVALAIRPTLENLIGGVILYLDKPVQVGDFCNFGDHTGTVEAIGIRSTQLRALNRTRITIPNAQFADMQIVNWAKCDQMLINETIGLRYETSPDQLRFVLAKLREMLHAHPRIDNDTIRVRFSGYGDSALNVTLRIYARTREWNDFHAIREDIFMRIYDLVTEAGTGFAFPSRTVYLGHDSGLDEERGKMAVEEVGRWRRDGRLPFPRLSPERLSRIEDTLDYPPRGSTEVAGEVQVDPEPFKALSAEPLSATDDPADGTDNTAKPTKR